MVPALITVVNSQIRHRCLLLGIITDKCHQNTTNPLTMNDTMFTRHKSRVKLRTTINIPTVLQTVFHNIKPIKPHTNGLRTFMKVPCAKQSIIILIIITTIILTSKVYVHMCIILNHTFKCKQDSSYNVTPETSLQSNLYYTNNYINYHTHSYTFPPTYLWTDASHTQQL